MFIHVFSELPNTLKLDSLFLDLTVTAQIKSASFLLSTGGKFPMSCHSETLG